MGRRGPGSIEADKINDRLTTRSSVVAASLIFPLSPGFIRPVDVMSSVGKIKPALCHRHQEFTVGWIARLPEQGQTLRRTLAITLDVTHHTTLDDAHPTSAPR